MTSQPVQIHIPNDLPGMNPFFVGWLFPGPPAILVDTGPAGSAPALLAALEETGISDLDYVLLTHIHIDHGGGLAAVLARYPQARAVCHNMGVRHLQDPSVLYEGSLKVLGDLARRYGRPGPVDRDRILGHTQARIEGVTILETPGHAPHHLSFVVSGYLAAGEAGGNLLQVGERRYLRPATPPRFFLPETLQSVDRLLDLPRMPICYAHFGRAENSRAMLTRFRNQLLRWAELISRRLEGTAPGESTKSLEKILVQELLTLDPELSGIGELEPEQQERERVFMTNSVRGFLGYLAPKA